MLSPGNVDKGSICNSIGQNLGYYLTYILFIALHDPKTCNKYFRSVEDESHLTSCARPRPPALPHAQLRTLA